jgi:hypothetical protein
VGNADGQGRFAWFVDQEGEWTAIAEDGMGHRGEISLRAGTAASNAPEPVREASGSPPQWTKAILGLSAIFWLSGLVFWRNGRKGHARREPR